MRTPLQATASKTSTISITLTWWISNKEVLARWSMSMLVNRMKLTRRLNTILILYFSKQIKKLLAKKKTIVKWMHHRQVKKVVYLNSLINFNCLIKIICWPRLLHLFQKLIQRKKHQEYKCRVDYMRNKLTHLRIWNHLWKSWNHL